MGGKLLKGAKLLVVETQLAKRIHHIYVIGELIKYNLDVASYLRSCVLVYFRSVRNLPAKGSNLGKSYVGKSAGRSNEAESVKSVNKNSAGNENTSIPYSQ